MTNEPNEPQGTPRNRVYLDSSSAFAVASTNIRGIAHALNNQFAWGATAEGHAYWADVSARLFSLAQNVSNLEQRRQTS